MLSQRSLQIIGRYWEGHLGCRPETLFADPARGIRHGGELKGYFGLFALFREWRVILSLPAPETAEGRTSWEARVAGQKWLLHQEWSPDSLAVALLPFASAVIGPAFIGYAEVVPAPVHIARSLEPRDGVSLDALRLDCDVIEWEHGGSPIENVCSGVFQERQLVALAGYEVWGGVIAHISIITHPGFRGRGYGRSAVAHVARRALELGLLPQYRTLEGNRASIRVAEELGFQKYATSMAVRF